jgi:adenylate cyclase
MSRRALHTLRGLAIGLAVALVLFLLRGTYVFEALELKMLDLRFRTLHDPARADTSIVIVDQDEASIDRLRADYGRPPWARGVWSVVVDYLRQAGAKVIVFDYTFADPMRYDLAGDSAFAEAAARAGNVINAMTLQSIGDTAALRARRDSLDATDRQRDSVELAALTRFAWRAPGIAAPSYQAADYPYPLLMNASAGLGVILFTPDTVDGTARRTPLLFEFRGHRYPALGLAAALAADSSLSLSDVPLDRGAMLLNWKGPYRDPARLDHAETFRVVPVAEIMFQLQSGDTTVVPPSLFRDKIVFLSASASGLFEARANPFGPTDPGVIIHATMTDNLLRRDFLERASPLANGAALLLAALLAGVAAMSIASAWASVPAGVGLALAYVGLSWGLFGAQRVWLDTAQPALAVLLTFTAGMVVNYVTEGRQKRQIRDMFSKYVAPEYVAQIADDPSRLGLEGRRAELSILFSDIRGFTTISESMSPTEVIGFLNVYLTEMAAIVKHSGGTLDKFIGDAVMAFWGEPVRLADHADRACDCALAMKAATEALAAKFKAEGKPEIRIGIGINTADVVVGNIGSLEHKLDYTVIGDGVNLASRLEGQNKDYGTTIIISEFTLARLGGRFQTRALGGVKVKGKTRPVEIFELLGRS